MARRLISLREIDTLEGLVERHHLLQERLEQLEAEAAAYDLTPSSVAALSGMLEANRLELVVQPERILLQVNKKLGRLKA